MRRTILKPVSPSTQTITCPHCKNVDHTNFDCPCDCHRTKISSLCDQKITSIRFNEKRSTYDLLTSKGNVIATIDCNNIYDEKGYNFANDSNG